MTNFLVEKSKFSSKKGFKHRPEVVSETNPLLTLVRDVNVDRVVSLSKHALIGKVAFVPLFEA